MIDSTDWYPRTLEGERAFYENLDAKIDGYAAKYSFLDAGRLAAVHLMCQTFIECYDKMAQNRATARQMTGWFDNIVRSKQDNEPVSPAPVFQTWTIPAGATVGIEKQCRRFAGLFKEQDEYDEADGLDLMIARAAGEAPALENAVPDLKISDQPDGSLDFEWQKSGFDMLELQWRKVGETLWQAADKSTEKIINFMPPDLEPGKPEKFEFRAIYLIKNKRVGQWSPVYTQTVG